ncbi:MAG TPA: hypothetical protein VKU88_13455 [Acidimicrobiales bacterium]|nr:hypothetical protein [Acidimicrobiales bacterium]
MIVYDDADAALRLVAAGEDVVLVRPSGLDPVGPVEQAPGRLGLMSGDPADPAVREAARAMDAELFRSGSRRRPARP